MEAIPGYLSLHQTADLMTLKWTPNQLMNGNVGELDSEKRSLKQYIKRNFGFKTVDSLLIFFSVFSGIMQ